LPKGALAGRFLQSRFCRPESSLQSIFQQQYRFIGILLIASLQGLGILL
jgi:hypothetical protein